MTLGRALAGETGVGFVPVGYPAVGALVNAAATGAWDVTLVAVDPARESLIDYAGSCVVVEITYLVGPGSPIRAVAEVDRPGVRVATPRGSATALMLARTLSRATLTLTESEPAALALVRDGRADGCPQNRHMLLALAEGLPGARVLDDTLAAVPLALALPRGRPAALAYVAGWVERAKASGVMRRAIEADGLRGVRVAPPATAAT